MGFDWEEILDSDNLEDAWFSAAYDAAQATGSWTSAFARTFTVGESIDEDFLLDHIVQKTSKSGKPYLVVTLQRPEPFDTIKACLFSPEGVTEEALGKTVHVRGNVVLAEGNLYLKIKSFSLLQDKKPVPQAALCPGCKVDDKFTLQNLSVRTASTGNNYLSGILENASVRIPLRVWNYTGSLSEQDNGKTVAVKGTVTSFHDTLRVEADDIQIIG